MRAHRRLSLLAGSSLVAATLMSTATVALLAPTAARAANECGGVNPATNGATADTYDCTGAQAGISYATSGNLTLRMNNGVATTASGVAVTSSGTDTVTISRVDSPAGSGDPSLVSTGGPGVSVVSTGTGAIIVDLSDTDTGDATLLVSGTTHGVRLTSGATAGSAIALTTTNGLLSASAGIGLQATSNSTAAGNIVLTLGGGVSGTTAAIQGIVNGTGTQTVALSAQSTAVSGGEVAATTGPAVQLTTIGSGTGAATLTVGGGRLVRANGTTSAVIDFTNANGARTVTSNGAIRSNDATPAGYDDLAIQVGPGTGAVTINNTTLNTTNTATGALYETAVLSGRLNLLNSGNVTITNGAVGRAGGGSIWHAAGASNLGSGNTTLNNNPSSYVSVVGGIGTTIRVYGVIATNAGGVATTLDFGAGTDVFSNTAVLAVGDGPQGAATLTILGLETWRAADTSNAGIVLFGSNAGYTNTDGFANDRIVAQTSYSGASLVDPTPPTEIPKLFMDVSFAGSQESCAAAVTADCFDLRGSFVSGQTNIIVNATSAAPGLGGRIVLVDVEGGTASDGAFVLDPASPNYTLDQEGNAAIDAGILHYTALYDDTANQFYLVGAPDTEALQLGALPTLARAAWDLATGTWFDRHADIRSSLDAGGRGGTWLKVVSGQVDQETTSIYSVGGVSFAFDTGYEQDAVALVAGADLVNMLDEDTALVFGVTLGHVDADTAFTGAPTQVSLAGYSLGAYATFVSGPVFLDAIVNGAKLDMDYSTANLGLASSDGQTTSIGFQVEGGWRFAVPEMPMFIEPLATVSYVRTMVDDVTLTGLALALEDTANVRAGAGLRVYGDAQVADWTTRYAFTARAWQEFNGETAGTLDGAAFSLPISYDDPSDQVGEVGFAVSLLGLGERLSLQLNTRFQFSRDYENREFGLGARYVW